MIFDEKKNLDFYRNLGIEGRYAKAVDFLQNTDLEALEPGKYEIDGKKRVCQCNSLHHHPVGGG